MARLRLLVLFGFAAGLAVACGDTTAPTPRQDATATPSGEIMVFAAASLTDSFRAVAAEFEAAYPTTKVTFNFAASSTLATQINQGAPADVFASADTANMSRVTAAGGAGTEALPVTFAANRLQIVVARGNPKGIAGLGDLARPGVVYVTAAPGVPIGAYAQQVLEKAAITVSPKSFEADVKAVVTKVVLGEADAGIVYATDVIAAGDRAAGIAIPDAQNVVASYPVAVVKAAKHGATARAFVDFLTSTVGEAILARFGFTRP